MRAINTRAIRRLATHIAARTHAQRVILFGSRATGNAQPDSDVDLLAIVETPPATGDTYRLTEDLRASFPVPVQIMLMTAAEFAETKDVVGGLAYPAARDGRVVYARS